MIVDEVTGEILNSIDEIYEVGVYEHKGCLKPAVFLSEVQSVDDMEDFMEAMVDKRTIRGPNHNDLLRFFESCLGHRALQHELFKDTGYMTVPQYKLLNALSQLVEYKNVIMVTREDLCEHLDCKDNNLIKKLNTVGDYIKVFTQREGVRKGEVKILINPMFFYIYEYGLYDKSRDGEVRKWYVEKAMEQGNL